MDVAFARLNSLLVQSLPVVFYLSPAFPLHLFTIFPPLFYRSNPSLHPFTSLPPPHLCITQVLPQLLYYLKLDVVGKETLDWGTLVVYTCVQSCEVDGAHYVEEVVWKQDLSE